MRIIRRHASHMGKKMWVLRGVYRARVRQSEKRRENVLPSPHSFTKVASSPFHAKIILSICPKIEIFFLENFAEQSATVQK